MEHNKRKEPEKKTPETMGHQPSSSAEMDAWNEEKDGAATLAVAKEFNARLCSMINAFSNGGSGGGARGVSGGIDGDHGDGGNAARASSLTGNYRPLVWSHFIGVETAARRLSKIAFPMTDVCYRLTLRVEKGKPGFVRKSFAERHLLWKKPVMVQLQLIQEESRKAANDKIDTAANVNGKEEKEGNKQQYGEADAHPNINDIRRWREVVVAMLKPQTDFGWHHHESIDGDAAKSMRKSLSSKNFNMRDDSTVHSTRDVIGAGGTCSDGKEEGPDEMRAAGQAEEITTLVVVLDHGTFGGEDEYSVTYCSVLTPATTRTTSEHATGDTCTSKDHVEEASLGATSGAKVGAMPLDSSRRRAGGGVSNAGDGSAGTCTPQQAVALKTPGNSHRPRARNQQQQHHHHQTGTGAGVEGKEGEAVYAHPPRGSEALPTEEEDKPEMSVTWHDKADTIEAIHAPWNTLTTAMPEMGSEDSFLTSDSASDDNDDDDDHDDDLVPNPSNGGGGGGG